MCPLQHTLCSQQLSAIACFGDWGKGGKGTAIACAHKCLNKAASPAQQSSSHCSICPCTHSCAVKPRQLFALLCLDNTTATTTITIPAAAGGRESWDLARFGRTVAFFNEDLSSPGRVLQTVLTAPFKALAQLVAGTDTTVRWCMSTTVAVANAPRPHEGRGRRLRLGGCGGTCSMRTCHCVTQPQKILLSGKYHGLRLLVLPQQLG